VLNHLTPDEMRAAVAELARVVRPGGRIALVETCHAQCRFAGDDLIMPSVAQSVANGSAGLDLREALLAAGCGEVESHPRPLAFTSIAELHPVVRIEVVAQAATRLGASEDEVAARLAELGRRDERGEFFAVMMFYVAAGTVAS
jgi:ubiquinone/menaquinone biosynthesis C-methylase UbiE